MSLLTDKASHFEKFEELSEAAYRIFPFAQSLCFEYAREKVGDRVITEVAEFVLTDVL